MNRSKLDALWHEAEEQSRKEGVMYTRYHFAALVEADVRKAMMQLFTDPENQPTQHGTVTLEYMQREVANEREACAKVCDDLPLPPDVARSDASIWEVATLDCAEAIRARSST